MANDAFALKYRVGELNFKLVGAKINKINQPDNGEIILILYANGKSERLIISSDANTGRIAFTDLQKENPKDAPSFCMLLRKHLVGGTILSVEQLKDERIVRITVRCRNDFLEDEDKVLYAEIMGKYSNIILTANGFILGAIHQAGIEEARDRPVFAGIKYTLPKTQDKVSYDELDERAFNACPDKTSFLFGSIKGISYQTANEIAYRYENGGKSIKQTLDDFYSLPANPCVLTENGVPKEVFPFPYLSVNGHYEYFDSVTEADKFLFDYKDNLKSYTEKLNSLSSVVNSHVKKIEKRLQIIANKINDCADMESDRIKGELITVNLYKIKDGQKFIEAENYYDGGKLIKIPLDENLSASKNAQRYYSRYNKQKRTLVAVNSQKAEAEKEYDYLKSVSDELKSASTADDLSAIKEELVSVGLISSEKKKKQKEKPSDCLSFDIDGFTFKVGRNNVQNDELVKKSKGNDVWLHAKNYRSAHGVFVYAGKEIPVETIVKGAKIIAQRSTGKNATKVDVDYTPVRYVKKPTGANPGFVVYTDFKTVTVNPNEKT